MTTASTGSAFPPSVDELVPRVRARAIELGAPLSRNRLMREFRVGADKARAVLDALRSEPDPANRPEVSPGRLLHAVTEPATDSPTTTATPIPDVESDPDYQAHAHHRPPVAGCPYCPDSDDLSMLATPAVDPDPEITSEPTLPADPAVAEHVIPAPGPDASGARRTRSWRVTLVLLALPAFVAIWSGWVGLGELTGFGPVHLLPGIADGFVINSAITLPIGVEAYAAFALRVWLSEFVPARARRFAKFSAIGSLVLGAAGQVAYHLMSAAGVVKAPWPVTTLVSCLPVVVLGCAAGLAHLIRDTEGGAQ